MNARAARWHPAEGRHISIDGVARGMILAIDHHEFRHQPWRVYEIRRRDDDWFDLILRPDGDLFDFAHHNKTLGVRRHAPVYRLPEHYGLCHSCSELMPCSERWTESVSDAEAERTARFEVEGICPSCQKPVTRRQNVQRFDENLYVPLGPPVTFHGRQRCFGGAVDYDRALAAKNGTEPRLWCEGLIVHHHDGERVCTNITCPSPTVPHRSMAMCHVLNAKCNRPECWAIEQGEHA